MHMCVCVVEIKRERAVGLEAGRRGEIPWWADG